MTMLGARCYNQTIGRFLAHDPLSSAAPGWTGYRWAGDDPVNVTDPTGLYEYTDGYGTWDIASVAGATVVYGNLERPPGQSGDAVDERQIIYNSDGKPIEVRVGSPQARSDQGPGGPILPGHHLFGLVESRQDDVGNWHYYKPGTNEEIRTSESGWNYLLNNANAFLPNALGAITKWLNAWKARSAGEATVQTTKINNYFVKFSSKIGRSPAGQRVFNFQARFPKSNLNVRLDRGFRAPFKNIKSPYLGKPYNGFNTHINIQKPGSFNYHFPLNPLKWKYYNIP